jgi:predicted nucleotidyltransferase
LVRLSSIGSQNFSLRNDMDNNELIAKITEKIRMYYNPQEIILFVSYSNGSQERGSDLDILIIKERAFSLIDQLPKGKLQTAIDFLAYL